MKKRSKSRTWAVQAAYTMHLSGEAGADILNDFFRWRKIGEQNRELTEKLVLELEEHLAEVDEAISGYLKNWSPERLARLDRIILRLGVTELLYLNDIPPSVTINEYVELARLFGTDESPRFVNAVLDSIRKDHVADIAGSPPSGKEEKS
jgi:N utilization substance protein B